MVVERERPAAVDAQHLEAAVTAQQPLVGDRDPRLLDRRDGAVDAREPHGGSLPARYRRRSGASRGARCERRAPRRPPRPRARRVRVPLPGRHRRRRPGDPRSPLRLGREGVVGAAGRRDRPVRQGRDRAPSVAAGGRRGQRLAGRGGQRLGRAGRRRAAGRARRVRARDDLGRAAGGASGGGARRAALAPVLARDRRGAARAARRAARHPRAALRHQAPGRPRPAAGDARADRERRRAAPHARRQLGSRHGPGVPRPAGMRGARPLAPGRPVPRRAARALPAHVRRRGRGERARGAGAVA